MICRISLLDSLAEDSIYTEGMRIYDFQIKEESCLVLGEESNLLIVKRFSNGQWVTLKSFLFSEECYGKQIYGHGNIIAVLINNINSEVLFGLGGSQYNLLVSQDRGDNWDSIDLPNDIYVSPTIFTNKDKFISYPFLGVVYKK